MRYDARSGGKKEKKRKSDVEHGERKRSLEMVPARTSTSEHPQSVQVLQAQVQGEASPLLAGHPRRGGLQAGLVCGPPRRMVRCSGSGADLGLWGVVGLPYGPGAERGGKRRVGPGRMALDAVRPGNIVDPTGHGIRGAHRGGGRGR